MSNIQITLPDGSQQSVEAGSRPIDIARAISPRLADAAIVAKVNGELYDLTRPLESDATLQILTTKDPAALTAHRHSTAHLLAAAVLELFPETKLGIGPPIDTGFYYDFDRPTTFTPEDLEKIEKRMWEIQARDLPYERVMTPKDEGLRKYADDWMKKELIEERAGDVFSQYALGSHFIDFCRGPQVPSFRSQRRRPAQIRRRLDEKGTDRRARGRRLQPVRPRLAFHRFLSRPARAVDLQDQGVQAALHRRRLLERRRAQQAVAAHLRHRLLQQEGDRRISRQARRSQEARPPQARQRARPLQHPGPRRTGPDLLPSQGRHRAPPDRRLDARPVHQARLLAGLHAARDALRVVEDLRPLRFLRRQHVQAHGAG